MDEKHLFDEVVLEYEKRRPSYGVELFQDVKSYGEITKDKSLIEIGCGTGQATEPFLKTKCKIIAVELGKNLAHYTRNKFRDYRNFEVIQSAFEDYKCDSNRFDMLYSATAFHWIPDEIGYKKAYRILKHGGTLALFWNRPSVDSKENPLHQKLQSIYREYLPQWNYKVANADDTARYSSIINRIAHNGFSDIEFKLYHNSREMTGVEYIELLDTYSDHRALSREVKLPLFNTIRTAIEGFGNKLIINDTIDLYLARKS